MGSRCSYGLRAATTDALRAKGARLVFAIGADDADARRTGLFRAHERVEAAGVETQRYEYAGEHQPADRDTLAAAYRFLLAQPAAD